MTQSVQDLLPHLEGITYAVGFFSGLVSSLLIGIFWRLG